jgi:hypothetical protein
LRGHAPATLFESGAQFLCGRHRWCPDSSTRIPERGCCT